MSRHCVLRLVCGCAAAVLLGLSLGGQCALAAETLTLAEPATDVRVREVAAEVHTSGTVYTSLGTGNTAEHSLSATAVFQYRERRLPPGGRDAQSLRALREFELATMQTRVANQDSGAELPPAARLVVARGDHAGVQCYSPGNPLTREAADLLELPGDPLVLTALLPLTGVEVGAEWKPSDWAAQMLASIEAVDKVNLNCRLTAADANSAVIEVTGLVTGQRFGANSDVTISGQLTFDVRQSIISRAAIKYAIKSSVGTINPGIDATVDVTIDRTLSDSPGRLTDAVADGIPIDPAPQDLALVIDAGPWGVQLAHDRHWYLFQALLEGTPKVIILRLMEQGSLVCQCNISPIAPVAAGQHTPLDQFEADIQRALGDKFKGIVARGQIPTQDGRKLFRILTEGEMTVTGDQGSVSIPMNWVYYLCADRNGNQVSFVFVVEPAYMELLANRDIAIVNSLRFTK